MPDVETCLTCAHRSLNHCVQKGQDLEDFDASCLFWSRAGEEQDETQVATPGFEVFAEARRTAGNPLEDLVVAPTDRTPVRIALRRKTAQNASNKGRRVPIPRTYWTANGSAYWRREEVFLEPPDEEALEVPLIWERHQSLNKSVLNHSYTNQLGTITLTQLPYGPIYEMYRRNWVSQEELCLDEETGETRVLAAWPGLAPASFTRWSDGETVYERPKPTYVEMVVEKEVVVTIPGPVMRQCCLRQEVSLNRGRGRPAVVASMTRHIVRVLEDNNCPVMTEVIEAIIERVQGKRPSRRAISMTITEMVKKKELFLVGARANRRMYSRRPRGYPEGTELPQRLLPTWEQTPS